MARAVSALLLAALLFCCSPAVATPSPATQTRQLRERINALEIKLAAQEEARDRQADAFDAATRQVEVVNSALAIILALGGIGATLLGLRWVRSYTEQRVAEQIDKTFREAGTAIFDREAAALVQTYDAKFADAYSRYHGLIERDA